MGRFSCFAAVSADPAAGAAGSYTVTEDVILHSFAVVFVTDGTSADRQPEFTVEDSNGRVYFRTVAADVQAASLTRTYLGHAGVPSQAVNTTSLVASVPLPEGGIFIEKGGVVRFTDYLADTGDNFGTMKLLLERR